MQALKFLILILSLVDVFFCQDDKDACEEYCITSNHRDHRARTRCRRRRRRKPRKTSTTQLSHSPSLITITLPSTSRTIGSSQMSSGNLSAVTLKPMSPTRTRTRGVWNGQWRHGIDDLKAPSSSGQSEKILVNEYRHGKASSYRGAGPEQGACGIINKEAEMDIASLHGSFIPDACGKCILVKRGKKAIKAVVVDMCPDCGPSGLKLGPALFQRFGERITRSITVSWYFIPCTE